MTNLLLGISLATSAGTLFYLLIPSCLEEKNALIEEKTVLRHAGSIMCACIWFFFLVDRLSTYFFASSSINSRIKDYTKYIDENKIQATDHRVSHAFYGGERVTQMEYSMDHDRWVSSGGHLVHSRVSRKTQQSARKSYGRLTNKTNMTGLTDMSNTSAVSGVTGITALPEYMKYGRIRLPKMNDLTFKGLSKVQAYGWIIVLNNCLGSFVIGMTIVSCINFSVSEGIAVTIALFIQELFHKLSDFLVLQQSGFNPMQSIIVNLCGSSLSLVGCTFGINLINSYTMEYATVCGIGFLLYAAFGVILPELEHAEQMMVMAGNNPAWPFCLQNIGMTIGFVFCGCLTYIEFNHGLPW